MPTAIPVGTYNATMIWTNALTTKDFTSSIGFIDLNVAPREDPAELAQQMWNILGDDDQLIDASYMASGWHARGFSVVYMDGSGPVVAQNLADRPGTGGDNDIPVNCAVLLKKNTALGGRRNRGRLFLPPFASALTTDTNGAVGDNVGVVQASQLTSAMDDFVAEDWGMVLHHSDGGTPTPITSFSDATLLGTQRRRMR